MKFLIYDISVDPESFTGDIPQTTVPVEFTVDIDDDEVDIYDESELQNALNDEIIYATGYETFGYSYTEL